MKKNIRKFIMSFFPVNSNAGRLRMILAILLLFIFWTIVAQSNPARFGNLFIGQSENKFTTSVIRNLLNQLFGLASLILTSIPAILLITARKQVTGFITAIFPEIKQERIIIDYLNLCAFSKKQRNKIPRGTQNNQHSGILSIQHKLGGPADLSIGRSNILITDSEEGNSCKIYICDNKMKQVSLEHKERVFAIIPEQRLRFEIVIPFSNINKETTNTNRKILIKLNITGESYPEKQVQIFIISKHDAWFLEEASKRNSMIRHFIRKEIERYMLDHAKDSLPQPEEVTNETKHKDQIDNGDGHRNYAQLMTTNPKIRKGFSRRHPRSHYGVLNKASENIIEPQYQTVDDNNPLLISLKNQVEKQVVSFFSLSNLSIEITSKG